MNDKAVCRAAPATPGLLNCNKALIVTNLKLWRNLNCDKILSVTKLTLRLKLWENSNCNKTQIRSKFKCQKTQNRNKLIVDKTRNGTNFNCENKIKFEEDSNCEEDLNYKKTLKF